jgi:LPXTG-motif cell wall-anchored protein
VRVATTRTASPFVFQDVPDGTYQVRVDVTTLPRGIHATADRDGNADQAITITMNGPAQTGLTFGQHYLAVSGIYRSPSGTPLALVPVSVRDAAGATFTAVTGADGSFLVEGSAGSPLAPGTATITAADRSGVLFSQSVAVVGGVSPSRAVLTSAAPRGPIVQMGTAPRGSIVQLGTAPGRTGATSASAALPTTGADSMVALQVAVVLIAAGAALVALQRRWPTHVAAASVGGAIAPAMTN